MNTCGPVPSVWKHEALCALNQLNIREAKYVLGKGRRGVRNGDGGWGGGRGGGLRAGEGTRNDWRRKGKRGNLVCVTTRNKKSLRDKKKKKIKKNLHYTLHLPPG